MPPKGFVTIPELAREHLSFDELIPDFSTRAPNLLAFLSMNGKWLSADTQELYNFTVWIAMSPAPFKEQVAAAAEKFIRDHLVNAG